ncbi:uncharacterized protein Z518_10881 [Rhinocladiella mackenziei CBS 650.93]|uniref:C6 transcription factor RegA n=1 Tax=Rhinocladiella mackenziei CBS 650.93 TaxID=1442369 RepID=A0A0D2I2I8_9EURO|nr:uncharacterized protein Z518_10881 [Rhinocladiella mackenziei CBS 650.93]KIW99953.1 hypothetical protein Z518_10881 [Rhinocladiella mackenziei CBS 650.93]
MDATQQALIAFGNNNTIELSGSSTSPHHDGTDTNPFSCNICKRSYMRVDHLARHYRSHTHEKPFGCDICGKSFARSDLLKRHANGHNQDESGRGLKNPTKPAHPRVFQACVACAEAKLRCEGTSPCGRCKKKGMSCAYAQSRSRRSMDSTRHRYASRSSVSSDTIAPSTFQMPVPSQQGQCQPSHTHVSPLAQQPHSDMMMVPVTANPMPTAASATDHSILDPTQLPDVPSFEQGDRAANLGELSDGMVESAMMRMGSPFHQADPSPMSFDDVPFLDFLRHVMTPAPNNDVRPLSSDAIQPYSRNLLDFNGDHAFDIDLNGFAPNLFIPNQVSQFSTVRFDGDEPLPSKGGYSTPGNVLRGSITLGEQAFRDSIWLWTPTLGDIGNAEQANLSLPFDHSILETEGIDPAPIPEQLSLASRDSILALILSTCNATIYPRVVSCFPSQAMLTRLLNISLIHHLRGDDSWIHPGTLSINEEIPEFLAAMIASGATTCRVPEIRKLGFAIQEAVRMAMPERFESDNRNTRKLRMLQSYALHLNVSLWSGDRRKMEIAESFALPLVTMMRRAGQFRRHRHPETVPQESDDERTTDSKWRAWAEAESFKRLGLHLFFRDAQSSTSLLTQPLISYSELSADLPYSRDLWLAKTAGDWKSLYLAKRDQIDDRLPSIRHCIDDTSVIFRFGHVVDVQMTLALVLSSIWALIWQYRQMKETLNVNNKGDSRINGMTANSLYQETTRLIQHLRLNATEWEGSMTPPSTLLRELCLMHLHVSLEDVQLLAGKEGEEEARKVFPLLKVWAESAESRQALFHAGQILRAAKQYPNGMLREASAVAVYHASLAFWAYAVLGKAVTATESPLSNFASQPTPSPDDKIAGHVRLDGEDGPELQRFLVLGRGVPSIRRYLEGEKSNGKPDVPLTDPVATMAAITDLLRKKNWGDERSCPPLVTNLNKLMKSLGGAAAAVRKR